MKGGLSLQQIGIMVGALVVVGLVSTYYKPLKELVKIPDTDKDGK
jgi:hypothetical protein